MLLSVASGRKANTSSSQSRLSKRLPRMDNHESGIKARYLRRIGPLEAQDECPQSTRTSFMDTSKRAQPGVWGLVGLVRQLKEITSWPKIMLHRLRIRLLSELYKRGSRADRSQLDFASFRPRIGKAYRKRESSAYETSRCAAMEPGRSWERVLSGWGRREQWNAAYVLAHQNRLWAEQVSP